MTYKLIHLAVQLPSNTPNPGEDTGIDFSDPFEVIVFVIFPILLVFFYLIWRKKQKKEDE